MFFKWNHDFEFLGSNILLPVFYYIGLEKIKNYRKLIVFRNLFWGITQLQINIIITLLLIFIIIIPHITCVAGTGLKPNPWNEEDISTLFVYIFRLEFIIVNILNDNGHASMIFMDILQKLGEMPQFYDRFATSLSWNFISIMIQINYSSPLIINV